MIITTQLIALPEKRIHRNTSIGTLVNHRAEWSNLKGWGSNLFKDSCPYFYSYSILIDQSYSFNIFTAVLNLPSHGAEGDFVHLQSFDLNNSLFMNCSHSLKLIVVKLTQNTEKCNFLTHFRNLERN